MKHREFICTCNPALKINRQKHATFLFNFQKSILLSLEKRKLLTASQRKSCELELEKIYHPGEDGPI